MGVNRAAPLEPKLLAVLSRLCEKKRRLTKTQAVKLPYLVDVIAAHVLGRRITDASYETWNLGVVAAEVYRFAKPGRQGPFKIEERPYAEGFSITLANGPVGELSDDEREIVDFVAEQFGSLDYEDLGKLTKAMNLETRNWGNNKPAKVDEDAYVRLIGRWDRLVEKLKECDTQDKKQWVELTGKSRDFLRKSLGV